MPVLVCSFFFVGHTSAVSDNGYPHAGNGDLQGGQENLHEKIKNGSDVAGEV